MNELLNAKCRIIEDMLGLRFNYYKDYMSLEVVFVYHNSELQCSATSRVPFDKVLNFDDMVIWKIKSEVFNKCFQKYKVELKKDIFNE